MFRALPSLLRSRLVYALALTIGTLAVLGVVSRQTDSLHAFDLDSEWVVPAIFSAGLLAAASIAAWRARIVARWSVVFAVLFAFMAGDELVGLHETLAKAVDLRWPVLYSPLILAAGIAWFLAMRTLLRDRDPIALLLAGGAGAWFVAQVLEAVQWKDGHHVAGYYPMMYMEETLEMTGSALFLLTFLALRRSRGTMMSECAPPEVAPEPQPQQSQQPSLSR